MTERLHFHFSLSCIGEGNGNPLQCSCLENPREGGAWWAAVNGVAQSRTRLKRLSSSSCVSTVYTNFLFSVFFCLFSFAFLPNELSVQFSSFAQLCLTHSDPMDCSLPDSFVHGIFQARVLEWVAIAFSETGAGYLQFNSF